MDSRCSLRAHPAVAAAVLVLALATPHAIDASPRTARTTPHRITVTATPYRRLMTCADSLYVRDTGDAFNRPHVCGETFLSGQVRAGTGLQPISPCIPTCPDFAYDTLLAEPDVGSFVAGRALNASTPILPNPMGRVSIVLNGRAAPPSVNYMLTDSPNSLYGYEITDFQHEPGYHSITVGNWVVWMLPRGFRSKGQVMFRGMHGGATGPDGTPLDCLVIVAGPAMEVDCCSAPASRPGIWFDDAIQIDPSNPLPVIFVTSGWFGYQHSFAPIYKSGETIPYVSVWAHGAILGAGTQPMQLVHVANAAYDVPDGLVDQLLAAGALPDAVPASTVSVDDGASPAGASPLPEFALEPVRPNPTRGGPLQIAFTLPDAAPTRVELLDVAGRRIADRALAAPRPGHHDLVLGPSNLAPGGYFVRVTRAGDMRAMRVVVLH